MNRLCRLEPGCIRDADGQILFPRAVRPVGFLARLRGLIARPLPTIADAWWFDHCRAVHGFGMRGAIDVVHLDRHGRVLRVSQLHPGGIRFQHRAQHVVELGCGIAACVGLKPGQTLRFET